jgi:hypothetical protein
MLYELLFRARKTTFPLAMALRHCNLGRKHTPGLVKYALYYRNDVGHKEHPGCNISTLSRI